MTWDEGKGDRGEDTEEGGDMIPARFFAEVEQGEATKNCEGDHLLDDFELGGAVEVVAPSVRGDHEDIFKERDPPTHQDGLPKRGSFELEMTVPSEGHEYVGADQEQDGEPA